MHVQHKHQVLGVTQAAVPVHQLHRQHKAREQQEHGGADVADKAVLQAFQLTGHRREVDVDTLLRALAHPVGICRQ